MDAGFSRSWHWPFGCPRGDPVCAAAWYYPTHSVQNFAQKAWLGCSLFQYLPSSVPRQYGSIRVCCRFSACSASSCSYSPLLYLEVAFGWTDPLMVAAYMQENSTAWEAILPYCYLAISDDGSRHITIPASLINYPLTIFSSPQDSEHRLSFHFI